MTKTSYENQDDRISREFNDHIVYRVMIDLALSNLANRLQLTLQEILILAKQYGNKGMIKP